MRRRQVPGDSSCHQGEVHDDQLNGSRAGQHSSTAHSNGTASAKGVRFGGAALETAHHQQQERGSA